MLHDVQLDIFTRHPGGLFDPPMHWETHFYELFVQQVRVKYIKPLKALYCFVCMEYTALGESLMTNIALGFTSCYIIIIICQYIPYKLVAVLYYTSGTKNFEFKNWSRD